MNTSRFYKKLTQAEVGQTKTHEVYIRMPNDFDYEKFFNNTHIKNGSVIEVNFTAPTVSKKNPTISQQEYDYRFVFFANSNKEKRIPGLGPLFKAFEVEDGDVVCLERVGEGENVKFAVTFYNAEQVQVSPAAVIITSEQQGDELSRISTPLIEEPLQIIYYGAPGTGKSHKIDNDPHVTDENTIRTTFHPDSDYSTFVGAYKPTMAPMPVNAFVGTTVHHAKNADNEKAYEKKIVYKYVPQAFLKAYVAAWSDLDNPHFLVIEEINRGNCAQIFGDLFQLLDRNNTGSSSYAIHADEDITQFLAEDKNGFANLSEEQKDAIRSFVLIKDSGKAEAIGDAILSGKKLLMPPNLYIWATMNTSDQSLFPIDSAFKRRWNWEYMPIDYDAMNWQFEAGGKRYLWSDFLKKMNPLIYNLTQSSDKQMGYFFAKADKKTDDTLTENNLISEKIFLNKVLFYLWTDVLKDFEAGDKIFRDEEKGQMYQFSDFFPTTNGKLVEFVDKLELPEVGTVEKDNDEVNFDSPNDSELNDNNGNSQRDYSKYSVNGQGRMSKSDAVVAAMTAFVKALPELSAAEILRKIDGFNLSNTIAYSEEDFNKYLEQSSDPRFTKRYARIETGTGESIYIYKGSTPKRIGELIQGLNNSGTGVILAKVE